MRRAALLAMAVLGALSGCSLSPRYQRPSVPAAPDSYKEAGVARAAYDEQVADYRGTVLVAFQEVEDGLAALRQLQRKSVSQAAAVTATQGALDQANLRYKGGIVSYRAPHQGLGRGLGGDWQRR